MKHPHNWVSPSTSILNATSGHNLTDKKKACQIGNPQLLKQLKAPERFCSTATPKLDTGERSHQKNGSKRWEMGL